MHRRLIDRLRSLWPWRDRAAELDEEIAFHLAEEAEAQRAGGATDAAARAAARRDFGSVAMVREDVREAWGWGPIERFVQDVRYAVRALTAAPIVSIVAVLTLTLAIGANSAIFSLVNGLLLRPLPVVAPERLVLLTDAAGERMFCSNPQWEQLRDHAVFDGAFAWGVQRFDLAPSGASDHVAGLWASGRMFEVLGVQAAVGRTLTAEDDRRALGPDGPVAVLGYDFWQRRFGGSPAAIGRRITIERVPFTIVGVAPPSFFGAEVGRSFDVAIPIAAATLIRGTDFLDRRTSIWLRVMFRLKPGQTPEAAAAQLAALTPAIRQATQPDDPPPDRYLREGLGVAPAPTGASSLRRVYERPLAIVMGLVVFVLLIACANLANLLLARAAARRPELSLRVALGASRSRIARQLLLESLLVAAAGAAGGLVVARVASRSIVHALSTINTTVHVDVSLDWRSLGFTVAMGTLTALFFGIAPALRATRVQPVDALKQQGRPGGTATHGRLGHTLVIAQVALSLVLLVTAGLFVRTFTALASRDFGFDAAPVLTARIVPGSELSPAARAIWSARVIDATTRVPGVRSAALSYTVPLSGNNWNGRVELPGGPASPKAPLTWFNFVTPGWFATYGTALLDGRDFEAGDTADAPQVAIANEAFARVFANGRSPVGLEIREPGKGTPVVRRVVGWVKDAVYEHPREPVPPIVYLPYHQVADVPAETMLNVRVDGATPGLVARPLAVALAGVDPSASITFRRLSEHIDDRLTRERLLAMLAGGFGVLAVVLAGVGLYGVTAYAVNGQRSEIAVRMALGASAGRVIRRVLGGVVARVAIGTAIGVALTAWAAPVATTLLYGLTPHDTATITGAALLLGAVGAVAGWIPARRIARIDPARVLRDG